MGQTWRISGMAMKNIFDHWMFREIRVEFPVAQGNHVTAMELAVMNVSYNETNETIALRFGKLSPVGCPTSSYEVVFFGKREEWFFVHKSGRGNSRKAVHSKVDVSFIRRAD